MSDLPLATDFAPRHDGRRFDESRPLCIQPQYVAHAEGSALVTQGGTKVICAASVGGTLPDFRRGSGGGWITAEYGMLPRATAVRSPRAQMPTNRRAVEISRFLGRCLRAVVDLRLLRSTMIHIDCDVVDADGGTRCAALTGSFVALREAVERMVASGKISQSPIREAVAGMSVALVEGRILVDPDYEEDHRASVDLTMALTESGRLVEIHAASEADPYPRETLRLMIDAGVSGACSAFQAQDACRRPSQP